MEYIRRQLAQVDALPQLALLAILVGLLTGLVTLVFRLAVEHALGHWLLNGDSESFETLSYVQRFALPVLGALLLGLVFSRLSDVDRRVGVVHVLERLSRHQGQMPLRNAVVQLFGGIIALASGQSGGREGPAVHLGAASASLLGRALELPNNSIRTLVACGTAAAIGGSFNTPIAGVIFAMEVIVMDYTIAGFIPVIIAAVTATLLTQAFLGAEVTFVVEPLQLLSLLEIPYIVFAGLVIGLASALFIRMTQFFTRLSDLPFWTRALLAGSITGFAAITVPEVMGIGYDTVNAALLGDVAFATLLLVVALKMITSSAAVGLGLPVGVIGPAVVIGAALGGSLDHIGILLFPEVVTSTGLYVMLGMAAMMAAVLQAPLAALMAVLELTSNPNLILPAMLIIVVATMTSSVVFGHRSVFLTTLETLGLQYPPNPVTLHLQKAGVSAIMNRDITRLATPCSAEAAREAMRTTPRWIAVEPAPGVIDCMLNAADLAAHVNEAAERTDTGGDSDAAASIDLLEIPGLRMDVADIDYRATLAEAQDALDRVDAEALCVRRVTAPGVASVMGVVMQQDIDNYREPPT